MEPIKTITITPDVYEQAIETLAAEVAHLRARLAIAEALLSRQDNSG